MGARGGLSLAVGERVPVGGGADGRGREGCAFRREECVAANVAANFLLLDAVRLDKFLVGKQPGSCLQVVGYQYLADGQGVPDDTRGEAVPRPDSWFSVLF
jgi:hypothetical protein